MSNANGCDYDSFRERFIQRFITVDESLIRLVYNATTSDSSVLIQGPSGVGKEIVATSLAKFGQWSTKPFQSINCALIPREHLYAELFGYEKGAFTGATVRKRGVFEQADGGTLFIDEVGDLTEDAQTGLLRVLETGEIRPLGPGAVTKKVTVRIVAATNKDVRSEKVFRADLFHRLNAYPICLRPLSGDHSTIPEFLRRFLLELQIDKVDFHFLAFCWINEWRGNVRELKNFCRFAEKSAVNRVIRLFDFVELFYASERHSSDSNPAYSVTNVPFARAVAQTQAKSLKNFHYLVQCGGPESVIGYIEWLRFVQEEGVQISSEDGRRIRLWPFPETKKRTIVPTTILRDFNKLARARGTVTTPLSVKSTVRFIEYPDIPVSELGLAFRIISSKVSEFDLNIGVDPKGCQAFIFVAAAQYEWWRDQKTQTDPLNKKWSDRYPEAKQQFEESFYSTVFLRHSDLSDNAIAKIIDQDPKTVAKKRSQYMTD